MSLVTDEIRGSATEFYEGDEICKEKSKFLLTEVGLPNGLLPLEDIIECGYVKETGFVWLKQKKKIEHKFEKIGRLVSYSTEVTAVVETNRIKKLTGVKARELLLWVTLTEIYVDDPPTGKIHFKSTAGISKTFPVSAFVLPPVDAEKEKEKEKIVVVDLKGDAKENEKAVVVDLKGDVKENEKVVDLKKKEVDNGVV